MSGFDQNGQAVALDGKRLVPFPEERQERFFERETSYHSGLRLVMAGGQPLAATRDRERKLRLWVKRGFDIVGAGLGLVVLMPLLVLVALAIACESRGPVLFCQPREGLDGRLFPIVKFRTMCRDGGDASGVAHTVAGDARVTAVGRVLRRTSIDELPQLINVLLGQMSLVGPRPHVPGMVAGGRLYRDCVPYYDARLAMLPGLAGWAQANGWRGDAGDPEAAKARVDHDIAYIQNFSLLLDLKIVLMTLRREFITGNGA